MRWMHLADLHIGKKVNGFSMLEDQKYVLYQVLEEAKTKNLNGMILAGDIYDKSVPSAEAVQLLDWFLTEVVQMGLPVYMVSGNHDSGERLSFGSELLKKSGVHVASVYNGVLEPIVLEDEYGPLNLYLLPFIKPIHVRRTFEKKNGIEDETVFTETSIKDYNEAIAKVLQESNVDSSARNVLVAHQLVMGAVTCDSEEISIGGLDAISAQAFDDFDYVALGHIHGPQSMKRDSVRYAGTLLKYSFSECNHKKSITIVELKEKGEVVIETIPVKFHRDMRVIKGEYATLMSKSYYEKFSRDDYIKVILTDEKEIPEVMGKLRSVYPNIMLLEYENSKTKNRSDVVSKNCKKEKQPFEYFKEFYSRQNAADMDEKQENIILEQMKEIWGE